MTHPSRPEQRDRTTDSTTHTAPPAGTAIRLVLAWGLVSIPLAWGVYQTVVKSMALFE